MTRLVLSAQAARSAATSDRSSKSCLADFWHLFSRAFIVSVNNAFVHFQLHSAKQALAHPCNKCTEVESRLHETESQIGMLERSLQQEKELSERLHNYITELETTVHQTAADTETQVLF